MKVKLLFTLLGISIVFLIVTSFRNLAFLGLSYDEVLFVNASLMKDPNTFISRQIFGIPIMVWDHIGALKSWIYYPIFKIFGVSNYSIRIPTLMLLLVNLYLTYEIAIKYFNKSKVLGLIIVLSTDLSFVNCQVIDHGPSAIETFLKLLVIYFISRSTDKSNFLKIGIFLFLGLFNKLNFIWFINSLFGYFVIIEILKIVSNKSETTYWEAFKKGNLPKITVCFAVLAVYMLLIFKVQHLQTERPTDLSGWLLQFKTQLTTIAETFTSFRYYNYLGWTRPHHIILTVAYIGLTTVILINLFWLFTKKIKTNQPIFFALVISFLIALQILATKVAWNVWHVLMIYPFLHLVIINTAYIITRKTGKMGRYLFLSFILIWFGYNIKTQIDFQKGLNSEKTFALYQPQIKNLIEITQAMPQHEIFTIGWGIQSQLLVTDKKSKEYIEFVIGLNLHHFNKKLEKIKGFPGNYNDILVVENIMGGRFGNRENYDEMKVALIKYHLKLELVKTIKNKADWSLFNVFKVVPEKKA
jgi:hypothetical protein